MFLKYTQTYHIPDKHFVIIVLFMILRVSNLF